MDEQEVVEEYSAFIRRYTEGEITAAEFSLAYLEKYKEDDPGSTSPELFDALDHLFAEADAYCEDPELRDEWDIDEEELREAALETLERLEKLADESTGRD